jgi:hypothetical protein
MGCLAAGMMGDNTVNTLQDFATIGVPALFGLLGWAILRQRNAPPLLAGCSALVIALIVMTAMFAVIYVV